jgi:hypothetical protein
VRPSPTIVVGNDFVSIGVEALAVEIARRADRPDLYRPPAAA